MFILKIRGSSIGIAGDWFEVEIRTKISDFEGVKFLLVRQLSIIGYWNSDSSYIYFSSTITHYYNGMERVGGYRWAVSVEGREVKVKYGVLPL